MPTVSYTINGPKIDNKQFLKVFSTRNWVRSPRVNGKLLLQANAYTKLYGEYTSFSVSRAYSGNFPENPRVDVQTFPGHYSNITRLTSEGYAKLRGKVYEGSAALGVTLASMRQSREMIIKRYNQLTGRADNLSSRLATEYQRFKRPRRSRRARLLAKRRWDRQLADAHLEVIFGWTPLLTDIHRSCTSVIQLAGNRTFVSSKVSGSDYSVSKYSVGSISRHQSYRVVHSACVLVKNPNIWLLERAGLLNPATVVWDLVPWSFVVNMFVNTSQLVQSITDFAGLSLVNASCSITTKEVQYRAFYTDHAESYSVDQRRTLGVTLPFRPVFRLPEASWSTAAMAASLFTQKFSLVNHYLALRAKS